MEDQVNVVYRNQKTFLTERVLLIIRDFIKEKHSKNVSIITISIRRIRKRLKKDFIVSEAKVIGYILKTLKEIGFTKRINRTKSSGKAIYRVTPQAIEWALSCSYPNCSYKCRFAPFCPFLMLLKER